MCPNGTRTYPSSHVCQGCCISSCHAQPAGWTRPHSGYLPKDTGHIGFKQPAVLALDPQRHVCPTAFTAGDAVVTHMSLLSLAMLLPHRPSTLLCLCAWLYPLQVMPW